MRFGVIILAAGQSTRMGGAHKLLADIAGKPMITHVAKTASGLNADAVIMVTGRDAAHVAEAVVRFDLNIVHNAQFSDGLSTSLKTGIAALSDGLSGALILLGDMPQITAEDCLLLLQKAKECEGDVIRAAHKGQAGHPVFLPLKLFAMIPDLTGDQGAMPLIKQQGIETHLVEIGQSALLDADTPEALEVMRQRFSDLA